MEMTKNQNVLFTLDCKATNELAGFYAALLMGIKYY